MNVGRDLCPCNRVRFSSRLPHSCRKVKVATPHGGAESGAIVQHERANGPSSKGGRTKSEYQGVLHIAVARFNWTEKQVLHALLSACMQVVSAQLVSNKADWQHSHL